MSSIKAETKTSTRVRSTVSANCRAKDPRTCPYHGAMLRMEDAYRKNDLRAYLIEKDNLDRMNKDNYEDETLFASNPVKQAFEFDPNLVKNITPPKWWESYIEQAETVNGDAIFPTTPELLDVIPSPVGDLAVVWEPSSQAKNDQSLQSSGIQVAAILFKSVETGEILGYLNTSWGSPESFTRSFGTDEFSIYRYRNLARGTTYYEGLNFGGYINPKIDNSDIRPEDTTELEKQIWLGTRKDLDDTIERMNGTYVTSADIKKSDIPNIETVRKDNKNDKKRLIKEKQDVLSLFPSEAPVVGSERTEASLIEMGYGSALYVYAAKQLSKKKAVLRSSFFESESSENLWSKLKTYMPKHVYQKTFIFNDRPRKSYVLDFVNKNG